MKTVWKYQLSHKSTVALPGHAKVLSCGVQGEDIFIWAEVETENTPEDRAFVVVGTGHQIDRTKRLTFIGTVFVGPFVFHVYEVIEPTCSAILASLCGPQS